MKRIVGFAEKFHPVLCILLLFPSFVIAAPNIAEFTYSPNPAIAGKPVTLRVKTSSAARVVALGFRDAQDVRVVFTGSGTSWSATTTINQTGNRPVLLGAQDSNKVNGSAYNGTINVIQATNGACGTVNGSTVSSVPSYNLCSSGSASSVSGSGPWNWNCNSTNGGSSASCSANKRIPAVNGSCGSANGSTVSSAPSTNLCSSGSASSITGSGPWNWNCNGSNGGNNTSCSASKTAPAAAPNIADFTYSPNPAVAGKPVTLNVKTSSAAKDVVLGFKDTPDVKIVFTGSGTSWSATTTLNQAGNRAILLGAQNSNNARGSAYNGSINVVQATNGSCGSANGSTVSSAPSTNLCSSGSASSITGSGPWNWNCNGSNGGNNTSCSASKTAPAAAPNIADFTYSPNPAVAGKPVTLNVKTSSAAKDVVLGFKDTPDVKIVFTGSGTSWSATTTLNQAGNRAILLGAQNSNNARGSAYNGSINVVQATNGSCGSANGSTVSSAPSTNLCSSGSASSITGSGPWNWNCNGSNGGNNTSCSASKTAPAAAPNIADFTYSPNPAVAGKPVTLNVKTSSAAKDVVLGFKDTPDVKIVFTGSGTSWSATTTLNQAGNRAILLGAQNSNNARGSAYNGTINIIKGSNQPPTITNVTPTTAHLRETTTFTVSGTNLPTSFNFTLADCDSQKDLGGDPTAHRFSCIPQAAGAKAGVAIDKVSSVRKDFSVTVDSGSSTSPSIKTVKVNSSSITAGQIASFSVQTDITAAKVTITFSDAFITRDMSGSGTNWNWSKVIHQPGDRPYTIRAFDKNGKEGNSKNGIIKVNSLDVNAECKSEICVY